jgi:hypothetical protein
MVANRIADRIAVRSLSVSPTSTSTSIQIAYQGEVESEQTYLPGHPIVLVLDAVKLGNVRQRIRGHPQAGLSLGKPVSIEARAIPVDWLDAPRATVNCLFDYQRGQIKWARDRAATA